MAFQIGKNCQIDPSAIINVKEGFLGDGSIVRAHARIEGTKIEIGREAFLDIGAVIGGGSCFDPESYLMAGDWLHMGTHSQINTARGVEIGHEFGCGIETKVFTHGAYIDSYNLGAPVQWESVRIGDNVWLPNAWVNPGVEIGSAVVVAARSLINRSLPSGCLAGGVPAKILKENIYPRCLNAIEKQNWIDEILRVVKKRMTDSSQGTSNFETTFDADQDLIKISARDQVTQFHLKSKTIQGDVSQVSLILKDQLRRNGVRFRFEVSGQLWTPWL